MSEYYLGEIRVFAGGTLPAQWVLCDGRLLAISNYSALFSLIGTTYGGDGITTFALPNLLGPDVAVVGRVPIGQGSAPNMSTRNMGDYGGSPAVTLTTDQLPPHTHGATASTGTATTATPSSNVLLAAPSIANDVLYDNPNQAVTQYKPLNDAAVGSSGLGQAHNNVMPTMKLQYMIAISGIFPDFE